MKATEIIVIMVILAVLSFIVCGCASQPPVWGQGDPTAEWQVFFGNDNGSRIDFVQTQTINKQGVAMAELRSRIDKLEDTNVPPDPNK